MRNTNASLQAPLILQTNIPHVGFLCQARNTNTSLRAPLIEPTGGWAPNSFPLPGPNWIIILLWVLPPLEVDASNMSIGRTSTSSPYQVHSSADGGKSPTRKQLWTQLCCWDFSHSKTQLCCWDSPTRRSDHQSVMNLTPVWSLHIQSIAGSHPYFRSLSKFAGKHFGKPITVQNIWYIHEGFLIWIILSTY